MYWWYAPTFYAVCEGKTECLEALLDLGADPNSTCMIENKMIPLVAAPIGFWQTWIPYPQNTLEIMKLLFQRGSKADCRLESTDGQSCSLVFLAVIQKYWQKLTTKTIIKVLDLLMNHGADFVRADNSYTDPYNNKNWEGSPLDAAKQLGDQELIDAVQNLIEKQNKR